MNLAPLTPPDCDLRDFPFMALDVVRLRDSDIAANPDAEVFRAAVLAWCVSWHQIPAASLPNSDAAIARLIGMGRDVKGWLKLREAGALRGFELCSDGRLYHRVVAEKARQAWEAKQAQRHRTEKARQARLSHNKKTSVTDSVTEPEKQHERSVVSIAEGSKGEDRDRDRDISSLRSDGASAPPTRRKSSKTAPETMLPDWLPRQKWEDFRAMRRSVRATMTPEAERLLILKLDGFRNEGHDIEAILNQSIENSYKGLFPVKQSGGRNVGATPRKSAHASFIEGAFLASTEPDNRVETGGGGNPGEAGLALLAPGLRRAAG